MKYYSRKQLFKHRLPRTKEESFQVGEKPFTAAVIESGLSKRINDFAPALIGNDYNPKILAEQSN